MEIARSNNLKAARNIGTTIHKRLYEIGIDSIADLAEMTAVEAYREICKQNPGKTFPVCYYLYSLEGALLDLDWRDLPDHLKKDLVRQVVR